MAIVQTLNFSDFYNAFKAYDRLSNFTKSGLEILFNHLYDFSEETGEDIMMDVIALCCEYEEATFKEVVEMFPETFDGINPDDVTGQEIEDVLNQETMICGIDPYNEIVVFQSF